MTNDNIPRDPAGLKRLVTEETTQALALALAVRQALRTLPLLSLWLDWDEEEALPMVLPTIRPLAASFAMALAQASHEAGGDNAALLPAETEAGLLAADVDAAIRHNTSAISRATSVVAKQRTQQAFMHARNAAAAAVRAAYAASAGSDPQAAARALALMAQLFDGWDAIAADIAAAKDSGEPPRAQAQWLLAQPLWLIERPGWAEHGWEAMREILNARKGEHWRVWTDWYERLLDPGILAEPPTSESERRRLQIPEAFWEQGPAVANEAIAALLAAEEEKALAEARRAWENEGGRNDA